MEEEVMGKFDKFLDEVRKRPWGSTAWISDKSDVIVVDGYRHVSGARSFMKGKSSYNKLSHWFEEHYAGYESSVEEGMQDCAEEGGGWHSWDMWADELDWKATKKLYNWGWVRIYFSRQGSDPTLTVHGMPKGIKNHYERTQSLKEALENEYWESCPQVKVEYEKAEA